MNQASTNLEAEDSLRAEGGTAQFVGFDVDGQEFAFSIGKIQEIIILNDVTPIPQVEDYMEGVTNLRGDIIPIINLRQLFGMQPVEQRRDSRVIVVNVAEKTIGCRVDSVRQVLTIPADALQPAPDLMTGEVNHYIDGLANLENRIVIVLNSDELLDPEKLDSVSESARSALASAASTRAAD